MERVSETIPEKVSVSDSGGSGGGSAAAKARRTAEPNRPGEGASGRVAGGAKRQRADAARNAEALVSAARLVFARSGVDAPAKEIADLAGVGVGTVYRHFPRRSDLIKAVYRHEVDAAAAAAAVLAAEHPPLVALNLWIERYSGFLATKHGLSAALHSGDQTYADLPPYFRENFGPALGGLLDTAAEAGLIRDGVDPSDLLYAVARLSHSLGGEGDDGFTQRAIGLLLDGLRVRD